jgi:hypothetical protein
MSLFMSSSVSAGLDNLAIFKTLFDGWHKTILEGTTPDQRLD